jgi:hypothetical protein
MTHPPNSYCRVTFYVASVLASSTEPQRLNTGEIEATWTDNRHRRPHQLDRRPSRHLATSVADPKPVTQGIQLDRVNHRMGVEP